MNINGWGKYLAAASILVSFGLSANQARSEDDLSKKLANPIASLISIPVVLDYNSGYGDDNGDLVSVTLKPVIPFQINDDLAIVTRTIIPIVWQNDVIDATSGTQYGWGDVNMSAWAVPSSTDTPLGELTWGLGGSINWPINQQSVGPSIHDHHRTQATGQWELGPTFLFLFQQSGWTLGNLFTQQWGFEKRGNPAAPYTNLSLIQPFLSYAHAGWTYGIDTESSYNWNTNEWSVPINAYVAKISKLGNQLVQYELGARYWADSPTGGPDGWGLRAQVTFLFPD